MIHLVHVALTKTREAMREARPVGATVAFRFPETADAFAAALKSVGATAARDTQEASR